MSSTVRFAPPLVDTDHKITPQNEVITSLVLWDTLLVNYFIACAVVRKCIEFYSHHFTIGSLNEHIRSLLLLSFTECLFFAQRFLARANVRSSTRRTSGRSIGSDAAFST